MASSELQLEHPITRIRRAAVNSHLDWTKFNMRWTQKRVLDVTPHVEIISSVLDDVLSGKIKRLLINMPPRFGKTEVCVKGLSSRIFALNPGARIMHTSYSMTLAGKNSRDVKLAIESPQFKAVFPDTNVAKDSFAKQHWNTTALGEFHAVSSDSPIVGFECGMNGKPVDGLLLIDDPQKPSEMSSAVYRAKTKEVCGQTIATRLNHSDTPVIVIQQRTHVDDISNWLMSGGTGDVWHVLCFQAISDTGRPPQHYREYSHAKLIEYQIHTGALAPQRKSLESLLSLRDAKEDMDGDEPTGKRVFACQYQQNPSDSSTSLFEAEWLDTYDPAELPWSVDRITVRIDTAQKSMGKNDHTGMVTFADDRRNPDISYVLDADRARKEFPALVEWILDHCRRLWNLQTQRLKFTKLIIEDANIGAALMAVLKLRFKHERIMVQIALTERYGSKFDRALESVPYFQQGRIKLPSERGPFTHPHRVAEGSEDGIKILRDEFTMFNEADTHVSDDILDTVIWEVVSKWGGAKKSSRFR